MRQSEASDGWESESEREVSEGRQGEESGGAEESEEYGEGWESEVEGEASEG